MPNPTIKALPSAPAPKAKTAGSTIKALPSAPAPKAKTADSAPNKGKVLEGVVINNRGAGSPKAKTADSAPKIIQGEVIKDHPGGKPPSSPTKGSTPGGKPPSSPTDNPTASVGTKFGKIKVSNQTGINNGSGNQIQVQNSGSGTVTINNNGPAATPSASATGSKAPASATSPAASPKAPTSSGNDPKAPKSTPSPTDSPPSSLPGDKRVWPPESGKQAAGPTSGATSPTSAAPPGVNSVNLTKAKNPAASVGTKFGKIKVSNQTGINNGSGNQIQVQNVGSGNVTINYNSPAAAKGDDAKGKWDWKAFAKELTKGAKDISDAGLKVLKENVDGAVRTASR